MRIRIAVTTTLVVGSLIVGVQHRGDRDGVSLRHRRGRTTATTSPPATTASTTASSVATTSPSVTTTPTSTVVTLPPTAPSSVATSAATVPSSTPTTKSTVPATTPGGSTAVPDAPCGLSARAFCETFDVAKNTGTRTGDLDQVLWGVSRLGNINPGQSILNDIPLVKMDGCGSTAWAPTPADVRICDGKMFETVNDGSGVTNLNTYPKQPFDFAGRTGKVTFDVSADSDGTHGAWPEFMITDKPVPGTRVEISGQTPPGAVHSVGFSLDGCTSGPGGTTGIGAVFATRNGAYANLDFTHVGCVTKGSQNAVNHFEVRIGQSRMEVWGSEPGARTMKLLAVADNMGLTFTKGLVWLNDVHYNARKAVEPCECGTQWNHTFVWDNLGFDGPKTYRDLGFDVPDANVAGERSWASDQTRRTGYRVGTGPTTLQVEGVRRDQTPTGALVVLNSYSFGATIPSISINGGPWIDTAWTSNHQAYSWLSIGVPVPVEQVRDGQNSIAFKSTDGTTTVANVSLILVAGARCHESPVRAATRCTTSGVPGSCTRSSRAD